MWPTNVRGVAGLLVAFLVVADARPLPAADQTQWGESDSRNMISAERGLPSGFDAGKRDAASGQIAPDSTKHVLWTAKLGDVTYGVPIVAGGRVYIGTNNGSPRDTRLPGDHGVLLCCAEKTGEFLWQLNLPKLTSIKWADWYHIGITSAPTIDGDRAYLVTNRGELVCLDVDGMADGNDGPFVDEGRLMVEEGQTPVEPTRQDADLVWLLDMPRELKAEPHNAANGSVLIHGDFLYVCTSNGVEWTHGHVVHPEAPSMIIVDKRTGRLVARDEFGIGPDITHGQWSSPAFGRVGQRELGFFGAGNGYLYGFDLLRPGQSGGPVGQIAPVWKFHGHPLAQTQDHVPPDHQHDSTSYQATGTPVFYKNRVYLTFTQEPFHRMKLGWLVAVEAGKTGDVTRSGLVWGYDKIGASVSTVAIADGLVYAAGFDGRLHCLDAETGQVYWVQELGGPVAASPLVADGKVYLGSERQQFWILAAGKEPKVLSTVRMRDKVSSTATAANGVLYVATWKHLYAVRPR
ncbi:MAG: PQQ-binding-like beta-propeller repeat protein [Thermoguttaceae bacterium]